MSFIQPMLCHEVEVNGIRQHGLDEQKVTAAYRKAIEEELANLMIKGFVAERKAEQVKSFFLQLQVQARIS